MCPAGWVNCVYSNTGDNVAFGKAALQSSTAAGGGAGLAVDGVTSTTYGDGSCTHTTEEVSPWWRVDLWDTTPVETVTIYNRGDCCGDRLNAFVVKVGIIDDVDRNSQCGSTQSVGSGSSIQVNCGGIWGQYVFVTIPTTVSLANNPSRGGRDILTLCEVKVKEVPPESLPYGAIAPFHASADLPASAMALLQGPTETFDPRLSDAVHSRRLKELLAVNALQDPKEKASRVGVRDFAVHYFLVEVMLSHPCTTLLSEP